SNGSLGPFTIGSSGPFAGQGSPGAFSGSGDPGSLGAHGSSTCDALCARASEIDCPTQKPPPPQYGAGGANGRGAAGQATSPNDPVAQCLSDCQELYAKVTGPCVDILDAFLSCAATAPIQCKNGKAQISSCDTQARALASCSEDQRPPTNGTGGGGARQ